MSTVAVLFVVAMGIVLMFAFYGIYRTFKTGQLEIKAKEFDSITEWLARHNVYVNWHPHYNEPDKKIHEKTYVLRRSWIDSDSDIVITQCKGISFDDFYDAMRKIRIVEKTECDPIRVKDMLSAAVVRSQIPIENCANFWKD